MTILFNNVSGEGDETSEEFESKGGSAIINIRADDFGGGRVDIQTASEQDSLDRFVTLPNGSFTANASVKLDYLAQGIKLRALLTSPSESTQNVFCDILQ